MQYGMGIERSLLMDKHNMELLSQINIAPYIQLGTTLITKSRKSGGNMFRHQMDTYSVLIDYGYIDSVLLKASVIHDCIEDIPDFDSNLIKNCDDTEYFLLPLALLVDYNMYQELIYFLESRRNHLENINYFEKNQTLKFYL